MTLKRMTKYISILKTNMVKGKASFDFRLEIIDPRNYILEEIKQWTDE